MNTNPMNVSNGPMSFRDAAIVATILTVATIFTVFMTTQGYDAMTTDSERFMYNLIVFTGAEWFTTFVGLAGLSRYVDSGTNR